MFVFEYMSKNILIEQYDDMVYIKILWYYIYYLTELWVPANFSLMSYKTSFMLFWPHCLTTLAGQARPTSRC